ncbi:hypothetical protein PGIGA_G00167840 [Pangasianodon gigas]|uniref:Uncharacterized protein n=1 Tax=Pangasianodon gigas TaxID=30993 RepID=A0ACC5XSJ4_PANGG|nr:hypothetical protein [Pangasianodon gigas]
MVCGSTAGVTALCLCTSHCPGECYQRLVQRRTPPVRLWHHRSPAACIPPGHRGGPRHRHTQCPMRHFDTALLGPHSGADHLIASEHLQRERLKASQNAQHAEH